MIAPLMSHRFRIDLMGNEVLPQMTSRVEFDLVSKTVSVVFRETCDCQIVPMIMSMLDAKGLCMTWCALPARGDDPVGTVMFRGLKIIAHKLVSDYCESDKCVSHKLDMAYAEHEFIN